MGLTFLAVIGVTTVTLLLRHRHLYPGKWAHTFSPLYKTERQDLRDKRAALRSLERDFRQERNHAKSKIESAERNRKNRVAELEHRLYRLQNPGRGMMKFNLGPATLYENVLVITKDEKDTDIPLFGLEVEVKNGGDGKCYLYLTPSSDMERLQHFPPEHPETAVREFEVRIRNAVSAQARLTRERTTKAEKIKQEIAEAESETEEIEVAERRLKETIDRQSADPRPPRARTELNAAFDQWQGMTGHRPSH